MTTSTTPTTTIEAIRLLRTAGCHFTLCDDPDEPRRPSYPRPHNPTNPRKTGMGRHWPDTVVPLQLLEQTWHSIGFVPRSLGLVVVDVDHGDPLLIQLFNPPMFTAKTEHGWHLYYHVTDWHGFRPHDRDAYSGRGTFGRRDSAPEYGCIGDAVYNGNCRLHPGEAVQLAQTLAASITTNPKPTPPPAFLYDRTPSTSVTPSPPDVASPYATATPSAPPFDEPNAPGYRRHRSTCPYHGSNCRHLDTVEIGCRECSLFDALRSWAYRQDCGTNWNDWLLTVQRYAKALETHLRDRVGQAAAIKTAVSVARYCWSHRDSGITSKPWLYDTSSETQRRRGRRGGLATAAIRRAQATPRRQAIYAMKLAGRSILDISQTVGLSIRSIYRSIRVVTDGLSPVGGGGPGPPLQTPKTPP